MQAIIAAIIIIGAAVGLYFTLVRGKNASADDCCECPLRENCNKKQLDKES